MTVESGFPAGLTENEDDMKLAFSLQSLDERDPFELESTAGNLRIVSIALALVRLARGIAN